jgi:hypothetical protein
MGLNYNAVALGCCGITLMIELPLLVLLIGSAGFNGTEKGGFPLVVQRCVLTGLQTDAAVETGRLWHYHHATGLRCCAFNFCSRRCWYQIASTLNTDDAGILAASKQRHGFPGH